VPFREWRTRHLSPPPQRLKWCALSYRVETLAVSPSPPDLQSAPMRGSVGEVWFAVGAVLRVREICQRPVLELPTGGAAQLQFWTARLGFRPDQVPQRLSQVDNWYEGVRWARLSVFWSFRWRCCCRS